MDFIFTRDSYIRENLSNGYGRQLRDLLTERSEKLKTLLTLKIGAIAASNQGHRGGESPKKSGL